MKKMQERLDSVSKDISSHYLKESVLDPLRNRLNPNIWTRTNILIPSVKRKIVSSIQNWAKKNKIEIKELFLLGSNTGFQYTNSSDVDIHVVIDEETKELWKDLPKFKIVGTNNIVEYYLKNEAPNKDQGSSYDILNDEWITKPISESPFENYKAISEIARFFVLGMDAALSEYEMDRAAYEKFKKYLRTAKDQEKREIKKQMEQKLFEIFADIDTLFIAKHVIKSFRREVFEKKDGLVIRTEIKTRDANTSINNLLYKYINEMNYFERIDRVLEREEYWMKQKSSL